MLTRPFNRSVAKIACLAVLAAALLARPISAAPQTVGGIASAPQVHVNVDQFADNVKQAVHGKAVGYSVAIFKDGKLAKRFAGGLARTSKDAPARSMSINDQLELGSVSKTVNAIVLLKALEEKNISIDASIYPYLPKSWPIHKSIKDGKITFKKLLSHQSGLKQFDRYNESQYGPGNYNDHVKEAVKLGVVNSQSFKYNNNNYELIRVLLAYVVNPNTAKGYEAPGKTTAQEVYFSSLMAAMAKTRVFYKANIGPKPTLHDAAPADKGVRYYYLPDLTVKGVVGNDRRRYPGRGGWKMTPTEITAIIAAWNANQLLSPKMTADMKKYKLGVFSGTSEQGVHYKHNGKSHPTKRTGEAQFMAFPGNVQVTLLVNSGGNTFGNKATLLANAFDRACRSADLILTRFQTNGAPKFQNGKLVVPVLMTVHNKGKAAAKGNFVVAVKYGNDWRLVKLTGTLAAGKSRTLTGNVEIPDPGKLLAGRTLNLIAQADAPIAAADTSMPSWGRVKEFNESNNFKALRVKAPEGLGLSAPKRTNKVPGTKVFPVRPGVKRPIVRPGVKPIRRSVLPR